uniref:Uncharacterized protein n=1 Tax=Triticum urartu TaxID=4572 RepID=A0A8R7Q729_TRIUA
MPKISDNMIHLKSKPEIDIHRELLQSKPLFLISPDKVVHACFPRYLLVFSLVGTCHPLRITCK